MSNGIGHDSDSKTPDGRQGGSRGLLAETAGLRKVAESRSSRGHGPHCRSEVEVQLRGEHLVVMGTKVLTVEQRAAIAQLLQDAVEQVRQEP